MTAQYLSSKNSLKRITRSSTELYRLLRTSGLSNVESTILQVGPYVDATYNAIQQSDPNVGSLVTIPLTGYLLSKIATIAIKKLTVRSMIRVANEGGLESQI